MKTLVAALCALLVPALSSGQWIGSAPAIGSRPAFDRPMPYSGLRVFNITEFGARCNDTDDQVDHSTTAADDTLAIRAAFTAAHKNGGGTVTGPGGRVCRITSWVGFNPDNATRTKNILFDGKGLTLKKYVSNPDIAVWIYGSENISVQGLTVRHQATYDYKTQFCVNTGRGILLQGSSVTNRIRNVVIRDVKVLTAPCHGFFVQFGENVLYENNYVENALGTGIFGGDNVGWISIRGNRVNGTSDDGIHSTDANAASPVSDSAEAIANKVSNSSGGIGLRIGNSKKIVVVGNEIENTYAQAIALYNSAQIFTVTGATNATPIVITTSAAHGLATGDIVNVHLVAGNTAANGVWTVTVTAPTTFSLVGSVGNGAYTSGGSVSFLADVAIGDNSIRRAGYFFCPSGCRFTTASSTPHAIDSEVFSSNIDVNHNTINGTKGSAVVVAYAFRAGVTGNRASILGNTTGSGWPGIQIGTDAATDKLNVTDFSVAGNSVYGAFASAVYVTHASFGTISGNVARRYGTLGTAANDYGISLNNCDNVALTPNIVVNDFPAEGVCNFAASTNIFGTCNP